MNETAVLEKIREIFRDVFNDRDLLVNLSTNALDIDGWDSLMHITILEAVRDEFSIEFSLDEMAGMKNVGDIVNNIMNKSEGSAYGI